MGLSAEQLKQFQSEGYVNLGPLFDPTQLVVIRREYDRLVTPDVQVLGNEVDGVFPYRAMLNFRSPELGEMILHPPVLEVASELLGPDVRFWWDQGINKLPGSGSPIDWHQDNGYQNGRTQPYLTFWLALDDSDLENGGLEILPGSPSEGYREHEWRDVHAVIPEDSINIDQRVPLDARAGDVLLFSSLLVHRTVGNHTSDRQRRAWVVQYCRGDQRNETTGEIYDNRAWAVRNGAIVDRLWSERPFDLVREHA